MNTPNKLTILRICLTLIIVGILLFPFSAVGVDIPQLFVNELLVVDIRYPIGFDFNNFKEAFTKTLNEYNITFEIVEQKAPHYVDLEDDLVKTLYKSYVKYTNDTVNKPMCIGGGTYARALKHGVAYGMEEVGQPSVAHMVDEFIDLDKLERAIAIYLDAIYELGK